VKQRKHILFELALAMGLLVPVTLAQKPPGPTPAPPPPTTPGRPPTPTPTGSQPEQPVEDLVMFLQGRVATTDGTPIPNNVLVERVCNTRVRQQVYATLLGDFNMQLGSMADTFLDASGDGAPQIGENSKSSRGGIPRRDLANCELRASASGFHSSVINLVGLTNFGGNIDVGAIVVERATKIEGMTVSATPYKAPREASKAYEKGIEAERNGKLANARKYFEQAVAIYPKYTSAWYQLGAVLQIENQNDAARAAFIQATTIDRKFLPPYVSLALMAYQAENWTEVLEFTGHILELDPMNQAAVTGYIVDLDPLNSAEAYFYNAMANYKLNKMEDAEKSALKAEHLDLRTHFPQVHLVLADIFVRKHKFGAAIAELQTYLELAPQTKEADQVRGELAKLEKLNSAVSSREKPDQK
jgi:tetratricopeptide (TPR) repeat protein